MLRPVGVPEIPVETAALARRVHPQGTDEMRVRDALGPLFGDEDFTAGEFADMYPRLGQPGLSPALLLMVTILQFRHNLSDREAAQAVADRISWKYALGLELDYTGFDASVLCEFRARLAEGGRADALLDRMLARLKAAGLVRAGGRQRTDSTHVIACVRRLNRIESVGEGLRAALEEIARISPGWLVPLLQQGWDERYGRRVETARLLGRKNASAQKLAEQIGADGQRLLDAIDADPAAAWMNDLPQVRMVRLLWTQHYQATTAGRLRWKQAAELPVAAERPHSPYDPDARYSTKGEDIEWVGSKAHLSESCDADLPHLITDVHTTPSTDPDVVATTAIQDKLIARGLAQASTCWTRATPAPTTSPPPPSAVSPWSARSSSPPAATPARAPSGPARSPSTGRPAPPAAPPARPAAPCNPTGAAWSPSRSPAATAGPARSATSAPWPTPNIPRRITIHPEPVHEARMAAHRAQDSDQWRTTYNVRAGVEGTVSQAVRGPDLRHSRYRGLAKTHLQNVITGMALNITRLGAHFLKPEPGPARRPTRIRELCIAHGLTAA